MESVSEDDLCWLKLDDFRMLLIKTIEPSRITPYLRQCQVISAEDEEQLFNDPSLVIRRRKVGVLLDLLQRTGLKGYTAFLESLELDYPQLYSRITGKKPNKTFSILIDTAGESGLTAFLMSELSRLQRALQDERRRRQQACAVAKEQEALFGQQQLRERELRKLTERVQKLREERDGLSKEAKQLRQHNYSLMAATNSLNQERSAALLANRDLQIEVERMKLTVQRAESHTRLLERHRIRSLTQIPSTPDWLQEHREESRQEKQQEERQKEKSQEDQQEKEKEAKEAQQEQQEQQQPTHVKKNLLASFFRLRSELHRAEEQKARCEEEKEELELHCAQLKRDAQMYRQQNKQSLLQLEEVIGERDKAMELQAEQQKQAHLLLQEKDQYREQVRKLTEHSDSLELSLLRSKGEELQLRTRLLTCNSRQCDRSVSSEEDEEPTKGSSEEVRSGTSGENEEAAADQQELSPQCERRPSSTASWDEQTGGGLNRGRQNFCYRRKRALRSKYVSAEQTTCHLDDSSGGDITVSE